LLGTFIGQFQETVPDPSEPPAMVAGTSTFTRAREQDDQDKSNAFAVGTSTHTEVRRESPDADYRGEGSYFALPR
jgi:hypothetical protein